VREDGPDGWGGWFGPGLGCGWWDGEDDGDVCRGEGDEGDEGHVSD